MQKYCQRGFCQQTQTTLHVSTTDSGNEKVNRDLKKGEHTHIYDTHIDRDYTQI